MRLQKIVVTRLFWWSLFGARFPVTIYPTADEDAPSVFRCGWADYCPGSGPAFPSHAVVAKTDLKRGRFSRPTLRKMISRLCYFYYTPPKLCYIHFKKLDLICVCRIRRPSSSVVVRSRPSSFVVVRSRPSSYVAVRRRPSSVVVRRCPSASVVVRNPPPSSVVVHRRPSSSVVVRRRRP